MLTRGVIIGKIVDDLSLLKLQVETRNRLKLFDLTKFCEDFFKELLNLTYNYNLKNLNVVRSNNPGLDLGGKKPPIAFQITSQKMSEKVTDTLTAITDKQLKEYQSIKVFIVGEKQGSYTVDQTLLKKASFNIKNDIQDINDLLRDIVVLDIDRLDPIYTLFNREFRQVKIELEPIDSKGNFESSFYNTLEKKPASPPLNCFKYLGEGVSGYAKEFAKIIKLYNSLASVPRVSREILSIIAERGRYESSGFLRNKYVILPRKLEHIMRISEKELKIELDILIDAGLASIDDEFVDDKRVYYITISGSLLNDLLQWCIEETIEIRPLLNTMDFTVLDADRKDN